MSQLLHLQYLGYPTPDTFHAVKATSETVLKIQVEFLGHLDSPQNQSALCYTLLPASQLYFSLCMCVVHRHRLSSTRERVCVVKMLQG